MIKIFSSYESMTKRLKYYRLNESGFTAAEIITVVAIIAILALIVVPKFWSRTEEARIARAKEEMARIADAEALTYADTGFYVQMGNLHNVEQRTNTVLTTWNFQDWKNNSVPPFYVADIGSGYSILTVNTWKGPYITYQQTEILDVTSYSPLDPWKNPYVFYGPVSISSQDSTEGSKIRIWSVGPNLVFDSTINYLPWGINGLAVGDDILYVR